MQPGETLESKQFRLCLMFPPRGRGEKNSLKVCRFSCTRDTGTQLTTRIFGEAHRRVECGSAA